MKATVLALSVLLAALVAPPASAAPGTPPGMPDQRNYMPTLAMGQRHAVNIKEMMDDKSNPDRAAEVREQVQATCSATNKTSDFIVSVLFTNNAEGEETMTAPGKGATPNLTKSETGKGPARLFAGPLSKKDRLEGYEADRATKSERALLKIYTEDMSDLQRQQFAMSYLQVICRAL